MNHDSSQPADGGGNTGDPLFEGVEGRAAEDGDFADERFMEALREGRAPVGPMAAKVRAAARAAYAMRRRDAVFADIGDDSADTPPKGLRSAADLAGTPRYLRFHAPGVTVSLEVTVLDDRRDIVGRLTPPGASSVEIRCPRGITRHTDVDAAGAFIARSLPRGPVSMVFHHRTDSPITTRWVCV
ncbi:MAG: hypothetical protein M0026_11745 [Nocardiopsaceae bacterium]|nr:hypothetical protein [Nocardiopsaceae bacterium]